MNTDKHGSEIEQLRKENQRLQQDRDAAIRQLADEGRTRGGVESERDRLRDENRRLREALEWIRDAETQITNKPEERPVSPTQNVVVVVDVQLQRFGECEASEVITFEPKVEAHERMPHVVEHTTVVDEVLQQPDPRLSTAVHVARALGCRVDDLLGDG